MHVVTDAELFPGRTHEDVARAAVEAGAPVVQMRDKNLPDGEFYRIASIVRGITRRAGVVFIVNDRVDVALATGADGVHVGQTDLPASAARRLIGNKRILGVSAATIDEALAAAEDAADYVGLGPIYSTATKADAAAPTGLELLREIRPRIALPIVAIGGIGPENIAAVAAAGADGAAVVSAVVCAPDMTAAARHLIDLFSRGTG